MVFEDEEAADRRTLIKQRGWEWWGGSLIKYTVGMCESKKCEQLESVIDEKKGTVCVYA